jgi:hypothetical protein
MDLGNDKILIGKRKNNNGTGVRETGWRSVNWTHLAQDRDQWRALVNTVMNFRVP